MMHQGADRIMEEIEGMTPEQQLEYWKKATEEFQRVHQQFKLELKPLESPVSH